MNIKLMFALAGAGLLVFSLVFFRTGSPELKGLARPEVSLSSFAGPAVGGKSGPGPTNSFFGKSDKENDFRKAKRVKAKNRRDTNREKRKARTRNNIRRKARTKSKIGGIKTSRGASGRSNRDREIDRDRAVRNAMPTIEDDGEELIHDGVDADSMDMDVAPGSMDEGYESEEDVSDIQ